MINTDGFTPAEVLVALFNSAQPFGMGFLHYVPGDMSIETAWQLLAKGNYFDYLQGRLMKVTIENPLNPTLYDRDYGSGAASAALERYRKTSR